jgi:hypothetical protein
MQKCSGDHDFTPADGFLYCRRCGCAVPLAPPAGPDLPRLVTQMNSLLDMLEADAQPSPTVQAAIPSVNWCIKFLEGEVA